MLSTELIASIRVVVVGVENPAQNDASGPGHPRVTLTSYLHDPVRSYVREPGNGHGAG